MKLVFVRHGETEENVENILQGQGKAKLNSKGKEQARKLAKRLKWMKIHTAYVSNLPRTMETAQEILKYHPGTKIIYSASLREKSHGIFEGQHKETMLKAEKSSSLSFWDFKPENGESHWELQKRIKRFCTQLMKKISAETILIVSHGETISILLHELLGETYTTESYNKYHPQNCAVTVMEITGKKKPLVKVLNCVKHLEEK